MSSLSSFFNKKNIFIYIFIYFIKFVSTQTNTWPLIILLVVRAQTSRHIRRDFTFNKKTITEPNIVIKHDGKDKNKASHFLGIPHFSSITSLTHISQILHG